MKQHHQLYFDCGEYKMKMQLPIIIIVCLSLVVILSIHFVGGKNTQTISDGAEESHNFRSIRFDAENAYASQQYLQAIQYFEEALELRPENAEICNDLGAVHYDLGLKNAGPEWPSWNDIDLNGSEQEAITALELALQNVESGYFRVNTDSSEIAKVLLDEAKARGASVFPFYGSTMTTLNILVGPTKEHFLYAKEYYLRAIELKSTYAKPYRNLGSFYMKIGIRDKGVNYLRDAYKRQPNDAELAEYLHQFKSGY